MIPSKAEFQELIDLCKVNRFTKPEIDINDVDNCVINSFSLLMNARKLAFKNDYVKLPAYIWMVDRNKTVYDQAMHILFEDDYNSEPYVKEAMKTHRRMLKKRFIRIMLLHD